MRSFFAFVGAAVLLAALGGCSRQTSTSGVAVMRIVQNMSNQNSVDIYWGGDLVKPNMDYKDNSGYLQVKAGFWQFLVLKSDNGARLLEPDLFLEDDKFVTILPTRAAGGDYLPIILHDDRTPPPDGKVKFRFVDATTASPNFDVYFASPNQNIIDLVPILTNVGWSDISDYMLLNLGSYEIRLTYAGTKDVFLNTGIIDYFPGQVRTYVLVDARGGGAPVSLLTLQDVN